MLAELEWDGRLETESFRIEGPHVVPEIRFFPRDGPSTPFVQDVDL